MLLYAVLAAIGLLFLFVTFVAGDVLGGEQEVASLADLSAAQDKPGGAPGFLTSRVLATFLASFGIGGLVARHYQFSHPAALGVALITALVLATLVRQFTK
jgi:hypothetical protein